MPDFTVNWSDKFNDSLLNEFVDRGFVVFNDVFTMPALHALQQESSSIHYNTANLTTGERLADIRGDLTHWIDESDTAGSSYLHEINSLASFCNRSFFTSIGYCEAHYAHYPIGFGYQWHRDNPKGRDERILSAVFYLNDNWDSSDGGSLEIIDKTEKSHLITPQANHLVLFDSNLQHQVQTAHRERFSIATWLRRN